MSAYLIVEHIITDVAKFDEYRTKVGPMITKYGGRHLTKGGSHRRPAKAGCGAQVNLNAGWQVRQ